jgi:surface antigen
VEQKYHKAAILLACALLAGCTQALSKRSDSADSTLGLLPAGEALAFQADEDFGKDLSDKQRGALSAAESQALEFGQAGKPIKWGKQNGAVFGSVIVTQPFRVGLSNCRRFTHRLINKSRSLQTNGTACRRGDGSWRLVQ